jgi:small-conductance mechanosensitive channel
METVPTDGIDRIRDGDEAPRRGCRASIRRPRLALAVTAWLGTLVVTAALAQAGFAPQGEPPSPHTPIAEDLEAGGAEPAPVMLGGDVVVWITEGSGPYTPQVRATRIMGRLQAVVHDRSIQDPTVTVTEVLGSSELRVGQHLLMVITERDVSRLGVARQTAAAQAARRFEEAIRAERLRYAPEALARSGIYGLIATVLLLAALWLLSRLTRTLHRFVERWRARRLDSLRLQGVEIVSTGRISAFIARGVALARLVFYLLAFDAYLTYVLALFPWTRAWSFTLLDSVVSPLRAAGRAFLEYLPSLFFVLVIAGIVYAAIRAVGLFFQLIRDGRIAFARFPAEWADPTSKIVRVLLIAFGVVVAFPYLPASDSPAFTGVSVFMGVLISLASSSALSNMIAGLVLTYTGAFRLGERVQIGEAYGDIVETSLLVTRIRTVKNEQVTIPNGIVLGSSVTNYSRAAKAHGLILHTSVTIGYDAPWRTIHKLLLDAAAATPRVLAEPRPFVWQTALNDFYVTYEINAYTDAPADMPDTYALLHANIQDAFFEAGVEIMSPHFTAVRDGNTVAIPEVFRPPGYRPPAFRVERAEPPRAASHPGAATGPDQKDGR